MKLISHIKSASNNLMYAPLRSLLAMIGIIVGTASVVALVSAGNLAAQKSLDLFKSLGTNQMSITIDAKDRSGESKNVRPKQVFPMKSHVPEITLIAPYALDYVQGSYNEININPDLIGSTPELANIIRIKLKQGRFFTALDKNENFCVVGSEIAEKLNSLSLVGKRLRIGKMIFTILGVAKKWPENNFFSGDINTSIMVPLETMKLVSSSPPSVRDVIVTLRENADIDMVKQEITDYFSKYLPDFTVNISSAKEMVKRMQAQQSTFTLLLLFIGAISLLVGGIGVMNIMLASISERRYEIGLRMAIGAQPKDIQLMFLMEAIMLSVMGGLAGVVVGELVTYIIALFSGWSFRIYFAPAFIGFSFSVMISVFFGFYPAYMASKLNPIEALRAG